jgi:hypothetical protein
LGLWVVDLGKPAKSMSQMEEGRNIKKRGSQHMQVVEKHLKK